MRPSFDQQLAIWIGNLIFAGGILGVLYFLFRFNVGVREVANMDLLNQRTNGILVSCTAIITGALFMLIPGIQSGPPRD